MGRENPYKDIEIEIRKQLAIVIESEDWRSKVTSGSLNDVSCRTNIDLALAEAKELLSKLPKNYSALHKLEQGYEELNEKTV